MFETLEQFWWNSGKDSVHESLFKHVTTLREKQTIVEEDRKKHLRLYGNMPHLSNRDDVFASSNVPRVTLNVVQMAIDSAQARIAKSMPKARFLTDDGDYKLKKQAENLERFVEGVYYQNDLYQKAKESFVDGATFGDGAIKFYVGKNGKKPVVKAERVFTMDLFVDEDEAMYDNPRQLYHLKYVNKFLIAEKYPKFKDRILAAKTPDTGFFGDNLDHGTILIAEGWKLPSEGQKGRHVIAVESVPLIDEEWKMDEFPIEFFSYSKRPIGFWSRGIAEMLTGIQIEINKLLRTIQLAMHFGSVPKVFVEYGSEIVEQHLNNEIGGIIKYSGTMPKSEALMRVPPELFEQLGFLYNKAFETIGLSQMAIAGSRPAGLNSGKAIREFNDTESERFSIVAQSYENFHMRLSKKIIKFSDLIFQDDKKHSVLTMDKRGTKRINWKDTNLEEDSYMLKAYPVNLLSSTPSGRLEDVDMMYNTGLIDKRQAMSLLDFPDLESITSLENAQMDDIQAVISDILDDGLYSPPDIMQDLELGIKMVSSSYLKYKRMNLETEKLELLSMWVEDAMALMIPEEEVPPEELTDVVPEEEVPLTEEEELAISQQP